MKRNFPIIALLACFSGMFFGCKSPKIERVDVALKQTTALAGSAYAAGDWPRAAALHARALERARQMDQPADIAAQAYALAACRINMGQWNDASILLEESAAEARRAGADQFNIQLLAAKVALWQALPELANILAKELPAFAGGRAELEAQTHILLGQIACETGDFSKARSELKNAQFLLQRTKGTTGVQADFESLRAALALLEGKTAEAAAAYDAAAQLLQSSARYFEMAIMLDKAGAAFAKAADKTSALDRSFRAARSFAAFGDAARAKISIARARLFADGPRDKAIMHRLDLLQAEIDIISAQEKINNDKTDQPAQSSSTGPGHTD